MARGVNKVMIVGNLGQDPELRATSQGVQVVNLSVATDESYKDRQSGQLIPKTEWHRIVLFGRLAEVAAQYLQKGAKVYLEGRLQTRKWTDKNNVDRYATEVVVGAGGTMLMLDSLSGGSQSSIPKSMSDQSTDYMDASQSGVVLSSSTSGTDNVPFDDEWSDDSLPF